MNYRTISTKGAYSNWAQGLKETHNIVNEEKLQWMSTMLEINQRVVNEENGVFVNESMEAGGYGMQGPAQSGRMGDVAWPAVGTSHGDIMGNSFKKGSGDMPNHQLAYAMNVAAYTVGLDIVPVIPMEVPSMMFGYMDHIYSANLDMNQEDQGESAIYIKLTGALAGYFETGYYSTLKNGDKVFLGKIPETLTNALPTVNNALYGTYLGKDRVSAEPIILFEGKVDATPNGLTNASRSYTLSVATDAVPSTLLKQNAGAGMFWALIKGTAGSTSVEVITAGNALAAKDNYVSSINGAVSGDLVSAIDQFIPEFAKPSAEYNGNENYTATRKVGELGTQNIVSLRLFSTSVEAGTIEVIGEITREQKRDLAAYGQDGLGQLYKAAQNELTQLMNKDILRTAFRLGVTSAVKMKAAQGADLNLFIGDPATSANKPLSAFGIAEYRDIFGIDRMNEFPAIKNAESNSSAENVVTRATRIAGRIQAASNMISIVGRHGSADFVVINHQVASALQNVSGYIVNPFENTITRNDATLHTIGTVQGKLTVYVDPNMDFTDTRILVGRKGNGEDPGLKMFIYTLGDTTQTVSEKAMSDKILVSNRYALVPCGFHPEVHYFTFAVNSDYGLF